MWLQEYGFTIAGLLAAAAISLGAILVHERVSRKRILFFRSDTVLTAITISLIAAAIIVAFVTNMLAPPTSPNIARKSIQPDRNSTGTTTGLRQHSDDDRTGGNNGTVDGNVAGEIHTPSEGQTIGAQFAAAGTIDLPSGAVGWLAVRKGNLYWPKEPAINRSGSWQITVFEGGPRGRFDLVLIAVVSGTDREINGWFNRALDTGSYPGMTLADRSVLLDSVRITKQ